MYNQRALAYNAMIGKMIRKEDIHMDYIKDLRDGDMVTAIYLCKTKNTLQTKAGKSYYSLLLQDKTGTVDGKVWDLGNGIDHFEAMDYIQISAQVISFQGSLQLNIKRIRRADENEYSIDDYMPCTEKNREDMYRELLGLVASVKDDNYRSLLESFFKDKEFAVRFRDHSAAKSIHHAFIGGLLEHTVSVAKMCDFYTTLYPVLNRDLLITAALFHDIGKVDEISTFPENDYTDEGQLVGHIVMGTMMLDRAIRKMENFPVKKANELKHCILAHHGELEFGSPKKPALIEAVALSYADNTDAKLESFREILEGNADNGEWFGFNRMFESNLRHTSK